MEPKNLLQALIALNIVVVCLCRVEVRLPDKWDTEGEPVSHQTFTGIFYESERVQCTVKVFANGQIHIVLPGGKCEYVQTGKVVTSEPVTTEKGTLITKVLLGSQEPIAEFVAYKVTRQIQVKKLSIEGGINFRLLTFLKADVRGHSKEKHNEQRVDFEYRHVNNDIVDITLKEQVELEKKKTKATERDAKSKKEKKAEMKEAIIESTWIKSKFHETNSASVQNRGFFSQDFLTLTLQPVIEIELCDQSDAKALLNDFNLTAPATTGVKPDSEVSLNQPEVMKK